MTTEDYLKIRVERGEQPYSYAVTKSTLLTKHAEVRYENSPIGSVEGFKPWLEGTVSCLVQQLNSAFFAGRVEYKAARMVDKSSEERPRLPDVRGLEKPYEVVNGKVLYRGLPLWESVDQDNGEKYQFWLNAAHQEGYLAEAMFSPPTALDDFLEKEKVSADVQWQVQSAIAGRPNKVCDAAQTAEWERIAVRFPSLKGFVPARPPQVIVPQAPEI